MTGLFYNALSLGVFIDLDSVRQTKTGISHRASYASVENINSGFGSVSVCLACLPKVGDGNGAEESQDKRRVPDFTKRHEWLPTFAAVAPSSSSPQSSPGPFRKTSKSCGSFTAVSPLKAVTLSTSRKPVFVVADGEGEDPFAWGGGGRTRSASPSKGTSRPSRRRFAFGWMSNGPEKIGSRLGIVQYVCGQ